MEMPPFNTLKDSNVSEPQWVIERLGLLEKLDKKQHRIELLEETIRLMRHRQFGASSEKHVDQVELFNEAELLDCATEDAAPEISIEPDTTVDAADKPPAKRGRKPIPPDLPRVPVYLNLSADEKEGAIDTFYDVVKEELDIIPPKVQVLEYHQEKAVYRDDAGERTIKSAPLPAHIIPKSMASAGLLAFIIVSKYADGLPLHCLERILKRYDIEVTRATLANWVIRVAQQLLPLINLLRDHSLSGPIIFADETVIQVLKEPDKPPDSESRMWVQVGGTAERRVILFDYDPSRSKAVPLRLFAGYSGGLQTDGYAGYNAVCEQEQLVQFGCWDHARRKFKEAKQAEPSKNKKKSSSQASRADMALNYIRKLYAVERTLQGLSAQEIVQQRQQHSQPILAQLRRWLDKTLPRVAPEGRTGQALKYLDNQWDKLTAYCDHGHARISNCLAENAIRPFVIGRRAWLFSDTPRGAHASATLYGLIETAKSNGLEPYRYLHHVFKALPRATTVEQIEQLLPWHVDGERLQGSNRESIDPIN